MNDIYLPLILIWCVSGMGAHITIMDVRRAGELTIPQILFLRLLCGPLIWLYGFWRLLGMFGHDSS